MQGYGWNNANQFWCYFDNDGYIVAQELTGQFKRIGVGLQKYNQTEKQCLEALDKAEEYRKILVEHDLIKKELTPDERLAALSTQVDTLTKLVEQQAQMIGSLTTANQEKPKVVEPEILSPHSAGENLNDKYVSSGGGGQILVSR